MVCIYCKSQTQVFNSRLQKKLNQVWRRRRCTAGHVFTSLEAADFSNHWLVRGSDKRLRPFLRDKLFVSLLASLQHRKTALQDASALAATIMEKLRAELDHGTLDAATVSQVAQVALNRFDKAASVHYQAMHRLS